MESPNIYIGCVSNLFVRQMHFANTGDTEMGHAHAFDHMTLLAKGRLNVRINNQDTEFTAPQIIFIKAELQHELKALSDNTVAYCIHALRDTASGDILESKMIPKSLELYDMLQALVIKEA